MALRAGVTISEDDLEVEHYYPVKQADFRVRQHGYLKTKEKATSGPALFVPFARDLLKLPAKKDHIGKSIELPPLPPGADTAVAGVPPYLVINIMLPGYDPPMMSSKTDGPGWSYIFYLIMSDDCRAQLQDLESAAPAVKALHRFVTVEDTTYRERMKLICSLVNLQDVEISSIARKLLTDYDMKPLLTRPQHRFYKGSNYFEMDVDVHEFGFLPRKTLASIRDKIGTYIINIGFTVEGRSDDELPEIMLCTLYLNQYSLDNSVTWEEAEQLSQDHRNGSNGVCRTPRASTDS